jgi:hypothetical protein
MVSFGSPPGDTQTHKQPTKQRKYNTPNTHHRTRTNQPNKHTIKHKHKHTHNQPTNQANKHTSTYKHTKQTHRQTHKETHKQQSANQTNKQVDTKNYNKGNFQTNKNEQTDTRTHKRTKLLITLDIATSWPWWQTMTQEFECSWYSIVWMMAESIKSSHSMFTLP